MNKSQEIGQGITLEVPDITFEEVLSNYQKVVAELNAAPDAKSRIACVQQWDLLRRRLDTWYWLIDLKFQQDTQNEEFKKNLQARDALWPRFTELAIALKRKLLKDPFRNEIASAFGSHAIALWEADILTYEPSIQQNLISESKFKADYIALTASAKLHFQENTYNISEIQKFAEVSERDVRHNASRALWAWFESNGNELDAMFENLVALRTDMAKKLGFKNFIGLSYELMKRVDYTQKDVENYRREVLETVVPLAKKIREKQKKRLGLEKLYAYDTSLFSPKGNPKPKGEHDFLLQKAGEMFDSMDVRVKDFFQLMKNSRLLDLKSREGKAYGGFCTYFPSMGLPFVFANFNGTMEDVRVFTHEMGHAFQSYSSRTLSLLDYQNPTFDSCEIHSMSLEFLTMPHMDKFFEGTQAKEFCDIQLAQSLVFLPYGVAIDHFQHLIYENPSSLPAERHAMWQEMEKTYLPWVDWHDLAYPAKGGRWQLTPHLYLNPFYYIDYTLALCVALQFWILSEEDREGAMRNYVALCERGGEASFQDLIQSAGLKSPFEKGGLEEVAMRAFDALEQF